MRRRCRLPAGFSCDDAACVGIAACVAGTSRCIDDDTSAFCLGGVETPTACDASERCIDGSCQTQACVPSCDTRHCGPDPVCGDSCGTCATGTCNTGGECVDQPVGDAPQIVVSATSMSHSFTVFVSRRTSGAICDADTAYPHTAGGNRPPDWGNDGVKTAVDPESSFIGDTAAITVTAPSAAQSWRFGVSRGLIGNDPPATVTLAITVDGVARHERSKAMTTQQFWNAGTITWNGSTVTVTTADDVTENFACVGDFCPLGSSGTCGDFECVTDPDFADIFDVCSSCGEGSPACGSAQECRDGFCYDDIRDLGRGAACTDDLDCEADLDCTTEGVCGESCNVLLCEFSPATCCPRSGGTCVEDLCTGT